MKYWIKVTTTVYFSVLYSRTFSVKIVLKCSHIFQYNHCTTSAFKYLHRMHVQEGNKEIIFVCMSDWAETANQCLVSHWMNSSVSVVLNDVVIMDTSIPNWPGYDISYDAILMRYNSISSAQCISCLINCTNDIVQHFTLRDRRLGWSNVQPKVYSAKNSVKLSEDIICSISNYEYLSQTIMNSLNWKQHF